MNTWFPNIRSFPHSNVVYVGLLDVVNRLSNLSIIIIARVESSSPLSKTNLYELTTREKCSLLILSMRSAVGRV